MDLLLCEQVFLLGHDDETGRSQLGYGSTGALTGALLLELALGGHVAVGEGDVLAPTDATPEHPLLREAVRVIGEESRPRTTQEWFTSLPSRLDHLDHAVGRSLVGRGVLDERQAKVLGLFSSTRWPEVDPEPERELRRHLADVLLGTRTPTPEQAFLVGLLHAYRLVDSLVDKGHRTQARATAETLAELAERGDVVSHSVGEAVRATQLAVLTAVMTSTVATTIATSIST